MKVEINKESGFCFGVINAINYAENQLKSNDTLYCLGEIVHNEIELNRLQKAGLITIDYSGFEKLRNATVLIRAHGEPPSTYETAKKNNISLIDATCPIVLKLQQRIKQSPKESQVLIFGKPDHPEVIGLKGQLKDRIYIISDIDDLDQVDWSKPVQLFSQTTRDKDQFEKLKEEVEKRIQISGAENNPGFKCHNTICGSVYKRKAILAEFSRNKDLLIFVGGKKSSNARVLFDVCQKNNKNSKFIQQPEDINPDWFENCQSVGIAGATSTPLWLLEKVAGYIHSLSTVHE